METSTIVIIVVLLLLGFFSSSLISSGAVVYRQQQAAATVATPTPTPSTTPTTKPSSTTTSQPVTSTGGSGGSIGTSQAPQPANAAKYNVGDLVKYEWPLKESAKFLCAPSSGAMSVAYGRIKRNSPDYGVEWEQVAVPTPAPGLAPKDCCWGRAGKADSWTNQFLGNPSANPTYDSGLKTVFNLADGDKSFMAASTIPPCSTSSTPVVVATTPSVPFLPEALTSSDTSSMETVPQNGAVTNGDTTGVTATSVSSSTGGTSMTGDCNCYGAGYLKVGDSCMLGAIPFPLCK